MQSSESIEAVDWDNHNEHAFFRDDGIVYLFDAVQDYTPGFEAASTNQNYPPPVSFARQSSIESLKLETIPTQTKVEVGSESGVSTSECDTTESGLSYSHKAGGRKRKGPEKDDDITKRRAMIAAASRATRAKRKHERESLASRNKKLEQDREVYLGRIAELQTEVQTLRDHGAINLSLENELLRTEIRKHKEFMLTIVNATKSAPTTTEEEKFRLAKQGTESAMGQVVGLCFTSTVDPSWHTRSLEYKGLKGEQASTFCKVQMLPLGSTRDTMKRVNFRLDVKDVWPYSIEEMRKKIWNVWCDQEIARDIANLFCPDELKGKINVSIKNVDTSFHDVEGGADTDKIRVIHYSETPTDDKLDIQPRDALFVMAWNYSNVFESDAKFPGMSSKSANSSTTTSMELLGNVREKAVKSLQSSPSKKGSMQEEGFNSIVMSCSTTLEEQQNFNVKTKEGYVRMHAPMIEGHILRRSPCGGSRWTTCFSCPVEEGSVFVSMGKKEDLFNEDGNPGKFLATGIEQMLQIIGEVPVDKKHVQAP